MEVAIAMPYGAMPARSNPSGWIFDAVNQQHSHQVHLESGEVLFVIDRDMGEFAYVLRADPNDVSSEVLYVSLVVKRSHHGRDVFVQTNVWQLPGCPRGFARRVMRYFSSGGQILISDKRQRKAGADMWKRFIKGDCADRFVYVQHKNGLSEVLPHTREMMIAFAYAGNSDEKVFVVSDQPIKSRV